MKLPIEGLQNIPGIRQVYLRIQGMEVTRSHHVLVKQEMIGVLAVLRQEDLVLVAVIHQGEDLQQQREVMPSGRQKELQKKLQEDEF